MQITIRPQTVITLIGPSHSGKSALAQNIKAFVQSQGRSVKVLSSDEIRRELLGIESDRKLTQKESYDSSHFAFKKLFTDFQYYMQPPFNTDVIIVDTTGLDFNFRKEVNELARSHGYGTLGLLLHFELNTLIQNATLLNPNMDTGYIARQYDVFKTKVLNRLNKRDYLDMYRITEKNYDDLSFEFQNTAKILEISSGITATIGDIHQQVEVLKRLLTQLDGKGIDKYIINGDWIDKDDETSLKEIINIVHQRVLINGDWFLIKGNHEEWVYNALKNPNFVYTECEETRYFTSLKYLLDPANAEYRQKFMEVYETAYDFARLHHSSKTVIISHSPCENVFLNKESVFAMRSMRNKRIHNSRDQPALLQHGYLFEDTSESPYTHIFGHVEVGKAKHVHKGKIAIDQGCVSGGHLTAVLIDLNVMGRPQFFYEEALVPAKEPLEDFTYFVKPWANVKSLEPQQEKRVRQLLRAAPHYVASTLPPGPSYFEGDNIPHLEDIQGAITHFKKLGVTDVIAQKKHMGSNAQIHLKPNLEDCYVTSRGGLRINPLKLGTILEDTFNKYKGSFKETLVLSSELMPWAVLGKGFSYDAERYYEAAKAQNDLLRQSSKAMQYLDIDLDKDLENICILKNQIDIYTGDETKPYAELFDIVYCDGVEYITKPQNEKLSQFDIPFERFNLNSEESCEALKLFYAQQIADGQTEGIVVKPNTWKAGTQVPTGLKVRNPDYLHIVYGHDYTDRLERLTYSKDIRGKSHLNIREQELNLYLLKAYKEQDMKSVEDIYKLLTVEFEKEMDLDPRL